MTHVAFEESSRSRTARAPTQKAGRNRRRKKATTLNKRKGKVKSKTISCLSPIADGTSLCLGTRASMVHVFLLKEQHNVFCLFPLLFTQLKGYTVKTVSN